MLRTTTVKERDFFKIRDDGIHPYEDGYYTFQQVIKVVDDTPPVIDVIKKDTLEVGGGGKDDYTCM